MIVYCDTSALIKLYIDEANSDEAKELLVNASVLATCRITWAEVFATFARRAREVSDDAAAIAEAGRVFRADWPAFMIIEITQELVEQAGELAEAFALRGYDSIHVASALLVMRRTGEPITFACFDNRLNKAAALLGMRAPFVQA